MSIFVYKRVYVEMMVVQFLDDVDDSMESFGLGLRENTNVMYFSKIHNYVNISI